jgi:outer membrane protein assembly factor BamB
MAGDWPVWRGPDHNSISTENIKPSSVIAWKQNVGNGYSAVTVCNGKVLTAGNSGGDDVVYCFAADTGKKIWTSTYRSAKGGRYPGPRATPVTDGKKVWMLSRNGDLVCIDFANGKQLWHKKVLTGGASQLKWGLAGSVLIDDDMAVINVGDGGAAYNKNTGAPIWSNASSGVGGYATPVPFKYQGQKYFVLFTGKSLAVVKAASGQKVATIAWPNKYDVNAADPIVADDGRHIFITNGYETGRGALLEFNGHSLKQIWNKSTLNSHFPTPVLYKGVLYGSFGKVGERNTLRAVDFKTGRVIWQGNLRFGSSLIAGDTLVYLDEKGKLFYLKTQTSKQQVLKSVQVLRGGKSWTMPLVANGMMYCRNSNGDLVCLKVK